MFEVRFDVLHAISKSNDNSNRYFSSPLSRVVRRVSTLSRRHQGRSLCLRHRHDKSTCRWWLCDVISFTWSHAAGKDENHFVIRYSQRVQVSTAVFRFRRCNIYVIVFLSIHDRRDARCLANVTFQGQGRAALNLISVIDATYQLSTASIIQSFVAIHIRQIADELRSTTRDAVQS